MIFLNTNYKYWESDSGLEELQAKIYNANNPDNPNPVTAKDIIERFEREKIDPKTVRYALDENNKPLAYIQARDYPEVKETHLGYPWALPECPEGVQDKLFDEMLAYIKTRDVGYEILVNVGIEQKDRVAFIKKRTELVEKSKSYRLELDVKLISQMDPSTDKYTIRKATKEDVDILVQLIKEDGRYLGQFSTDDDIAKYFSDRVLPDDKCYLVLKDDKLVMATAPLLTPLPGDSEERLILRFHSYLPDYLDAMKPLVIAVAKECVSSGLATKPLSIFEGRNESQIIKDTMVSWNSIFC